MAADSHSEILPDIHYDTRTVRDAVDGEVVMVQCHQYATLYTQRAGDCRMSKRQSLLAESAEETFYHVLRGYFTEHNTTDLADRLTIGVQYYAVCGLGEMVVNRAEPEAGLLTLLVSEIDSGWLQKWGPSPAPVNFISQGFIAAMFAATFDRPVRSYLVTETASIVSGDECSTFTVVAK